MPNAEWAMARVLLAFAICHLPFATVSAQQPPPALTQPVNDFANVIDAGSKAELERRILALKEATGDVLIVATVPTFQPYGSIEEFAVKMFENGGRGIGDKGKDNGLLILAAMNDRKLKIEVGYDLEGIVPDGFAGETLREAMQPAFRRGDFGEGFLGAATRIINRIGEQRGVTIPDVPVDRETKARSSGGFKIPWILLFWIAVMLAGSRRKRRRRYWGSGPWSNWSGGAGSFGGGGFGSSGGSFGGGGGGFGGGGFSGFGGGGSGGGGGSSSW